MTSTRDQIGEDIKKLWSEIYKPEQYKDSQAEDFFDFAFEFMPNKVWLEDKFIEKAGQLKERFTHASAETLLPAQGQKGSTIPLDGLCMFLQQTWDVIKNQKELNLPDQR